MQYILDILSEIVSENWRVLVFLVFVGLAALIHYLIGPYASAITGSDETENSFSASAMVLAVWACMSGAVALVCHHLVVAGTVAIAVVLICFAFKIKVVDRYRRKTAYHRTALRA